MGKHLRQIIVATVGRDLTSSREGVAYESFIQANSSRPSGTSKPLQEILDWPSFPGLDTQTWCLSVPLLRQPTSLSEVSRGRDFDLSSLQHGDPVDRTAFGPVQSGREVRNQAA